MSTGMFLTNAGRTLLAKALTGKTLAFTRAMCGNGRLGSRDPLTLTDLISPMRELPIQAMHTSSTGTAEVAVEMTNKNLSTGFFVYEYGLFARDPDSNQEVLYSYSYTENANYLEGDNGIDIVSYSLSLITVIDQTPNITASITNTNNYVTVTRLESRVQDLFADNRSIKGFWTYAENDTQRLRPASLAQARNELIGTYDMANLTRRIEVLEDTLAQTLLELEMKSMYPDYTHYIIEDFRNVNQIDTYKAKVTSIIAGDDSIDCEPLSGMLPGAFYTISDGINSEVVQAETISLENGIQRVILKDEIQNTYNLSSTEIYRTSAGFSEGHASGAGVLKSHTWIPSLTWSGQGENTEAMIPGRTEISSLNMFELSGSMTVNDNGYAVLGE